MKCFTFSAIFLFLGMVLITLPYEIEAQSIDDAKSKLSSSPQSKPPKNIPTTSRPKPRESAKLPPPSERVPDLVTASSENELSDWIKAEKSQSIKDYKDFIQKWSKSKRVELAQYKINDLSDKEARAWQEVNNLTYKSYKKYEEFLQKWPDSDHRAEAEKKISSLQNLEDREWQQAKNTDSYKSYQSFVEGWPDSKYVEVAKNIMLKEDIDYDNMMSEQNPNVLYEFLKNWPRSERYPKVKTKLIKLFPSGIVFVVLDRELSTRSNKLNEVITANLPSDPGFTIKMKIVGIKLPSRTDPTEITLSVISMSYKDKVYSYEGDFIGFIGMLSETIKQYEVKNSTIKSGRGILKTILFRKGEHITIPAGVTLKLENCKVTESF